MARAFIGAVECRVTADRDLGDTWAVAVIPTGGAKAKPMVVKLQGVDKDKCVKGALEILQRSGQIDRFEHDVPAAPPPAPAAPAAPAAK
jgi:hypothetical protein